MMLPEIYVSTDIEADGWYPGHNSMLSIGSAAFLSDKTIVSTFTANLETLPGAHPNENTMKWWQTYPEAWEACRKNCIPPEKAMKDYHDWLISLPGKIIFVGYPLAFDYPFVSYYLARFVGNNPFGFAAIDIRSFAMGFRGRNYYQSGKKYLPKRFFDEVPHTHIALDDAIEQGALFCNMLAERAMQSSK